MYWLYENLRIIDDIWRSIQSILVRSSSFHARTAIWTKPAGSRKLAFCYLFRFLFFAHLLVLQTFTAHLTKTHLLQAFPKRNCHLPSIQCFDVQDLCVFFPTPSFSFLELQVCFLGFGSCFKINPLPGWISLWTWMQRKRRLMKRLVTFSSNLVTKKFAVKLLSSSIDVS